MEWLPTDNLRSPAAWARFGLTAIIGLTLDLWTKSVAFAKLVHSISTLSAPSGDRVIVVESETYRFIPDWLHFHCTANQGAVFGLGHGYTWLFVLVSVGAILFLMYLFATSERMRFYQFILGLLLAGVLGNMYDRVRFDYVRDFIHAVPGWKWSDVLPFVSSGFGQRELFPWIFNIADSLLCVGVALVFLHSLVHWWQTAQDERPQRTSDAVQP